MRDAKELDLRGLECPQPVVRTKRAIDSGEVPLTVLVDGEASRENVSRMARKLGCEVAAQPHGEKSFKLTITAVGAGGGPRPAATSGVPPSATPVAPPTAQPTAQPARGPVVFIPSREMGAGDDKLGFTLMRAFLKTLKERSPLPECVVLINGGVKLAVRGAETLPALEELAAAGVDVILCGTCVDFFGLKEQTGVGRISNMFEIVDLLDGADRIIRP